MYRIIDDHGTFMYTEKGKTYFTLEEAKEYATWADYYRIVEA
jgi:hypothetical protein